MQPLARFHVWTPAKHPTSLALGSHRTLCGEWNLPFALSWRRESGCGNHYNGLRRVPHWAAA